MPGLDYLENDNTDSNRSNIYGSIGMAAFGEIGSIAGAWGLRKYAKKISIPRHEAWSLEGWVTSGRSGGSAWVGKNLELGTPTRTLFKPVSGTPERLKRARLFSSAKSLRHVGRIFGLIGIAQLGISLASSFGRGATKFRTTEEEIERSRYTALYKENAYFDTRVAFTQRQRALQVIHNSRLSMKPALGQESSYLHY